MVSSGTAALNEVMERKIDSKMRRTASRPIPAGRMSVTHASWVGVLLTVGGSIYLALSTNFLTGILTFLTSVVYLAAYTPLKTISPICTFVGAFPGAMPGVLGWTAARGRLDWGALALFSILFLWQFPHFFAIAWIYREDYAKGAIRMLPVVEPDGRSTAQQIILHSVALIPVSVLPVFLECPGGSTWQGPCCWASHYYTSERGLLSSGCQLTMSCRKSARATCSSAPSFTCRCCSRS